MKKWLSFYLALVLAISMAGCGNNGETAIPAPESIPEDVSLSNALYLCQFVKDCLGEPDSFQIHGVSHIEETGRHCYYLDYSHEVKNGEMERTYFYAQFDGSTLLCIVNENSAIYYQTDGDYTAKYSALSAMFQERSSEQLDAGWLFSNLE